MRAVEQCDRLNWTYRTRLGERKGEEERKVCEGRRGVGRSIDAHECLGGPVTGAVLAFEFVCFDFPLNLARVLGKIRYRDKSLDKSLDKRDLVWL